MTPSTLTPYQQFQLERYGNILPEQGSTGGYQGTAWWEREVAIRENTEPDTGTHTSVFV